MRRGIQKCAWFIHRIHSSPNPITAAAYSMDGSVLVYAKGYNWDYVSLHTCMEMKILRLLLGISINSMSFNMMK